VTKKVAFILSDTRSGSTLVDQLLAANQDVVTIGEIHWLAAYVKQDRNMYDPAHPLNCSCGDPVSRCSYWQSVSDAANYPLENFKLRPNFYTIDKSKQSQRKISTRIKRRIIRFINQYPSAYRIKAIEMFYGGTKMAADSIRLYDAIHQVTGAKCIVDSSKGSYRFWSVFRKVPERTRVILLARDYRAVTYSKMKRGRTLEAAAHGWLERALQMEALTRGIDDKSVLRLNYESLCNNPQEELERLCKFLDLTYSNDMLSRPSEGIHHIGGSPSKFDEKKSEIRLDQSYQGAFSESELNKMKKIVGETATIWGYD